MKGHSLYFWVCTCPHTPCDIIVIDVALKGLAICAYAVVVQDEARVLAIKKKRLVVS